MNPPVPLMQPFPSEMDLVVRGRNPLGLAESTIQVVTQSPIPPSEVSASSTDAVSASVLIVTHNNFVLNKLCLHSLLGQPRGREAFEVIVIDNASTDGTPEYLRALSAAHPKVRLILNDTNRGFAAANNQGLSVARGDYLVLLNNDTVVPDGWLDALIVHLQDRSVGTICATTNRIGNEAEIEATYCTFGEFCGFAAARRHEMAGQRLDIPMAPMFCHAMRRDTWELVGPLDEQFAVGMFEDDDYAIRVRAVGRAVMCAEDVFVHHFGGASFGSLIPGGEHARIFGLNREHFERKWGVTWRPHAKRYRAQHDQASDTIRNVVRSLLPARSVVAVISKGDERLIDFGEGLTGWHFPRGDDGGYAGHYPATSSDATAHLEELRRAGAQYLLMPSGSAWWLDHYPEFAHYLHTHHVCESGTEQLFRLFRLTSDSEPLVRAHQVVR